MGRKGQYLSSGLRSGAGSGVAGAGEGKLHRTYESDTGYDCDAQTSHQAMMPIWDDKAMDGVSTLMGALAQDVPMYHLHCLPDEAAARLTYEMIYKKLPMGSRHAKRDG